MTYIEKSHYRPRIPVAGKPRTHSSLRLRERNQAPTSRLDGQSDPVANLGISNHSGQTNEDTVGMPPSEDSAELRAGNTAAP